MKKALFILFYLIFSITFAQTQKIFATSYSIEDNINAEKFLGKDAFGSTYYVNDNVLYKKKDALILEYKNLSLGEITSVDFINPLQIIVFYEQYNTIITLDNQLNEIQKIPFSELSISAVGLASQNQIWIFDQTMQQIGLYNSIAKTYKIISPPIIGTIIHFETNLNYFEWIDVDDNFYYCSIFGKITKAKKMPNFDKIQIISSDKILFTKGEHLYFQDFEKNLIFEIENVKKSFDSFFYKDQILSIFTNRQLLNYKITIP